MFRLPLAVTLVACLAAPLARADEGALTVEVGGAASLLKVHPPQGEGPAQHVLAPELVVGVRRALTDWFELSATGLFEPTAVSVRHADIAISAANGTLAHRERRMGLSAGARLVYGPVLRYTLGLEAGWLRASATRLQHLDAGGVDRRLPLEDAAVNYFVAVPVAGVEWAFADKWSLAVLPRAQVRVPSFEALGFTVPLVVSHSWY